MSNDVQFLDNLYSSDFVSLNPSGISKSKSEELTRLRFKDLQYLFWEDKNLSIHVAGEDVVLKSQQTLNIRVYNLPMKVDREITLTFRKDCSRWYVKNIKENSI